MTDEQIPGALGQITLDTQDPYLAQKLQNFEKQIRGEQEKTRANAYVVLRRRVNDTQTHVIVLAGFVESLAQTDDDAQASDVAVVGNEGLSDALTRATSPKAPSAGENSAAPKGLAPPTGGVGLRKK